ncbi:MAG TPA: tetratricopeptide repeat protein, partial [Candidatus Sulfotelmatobacter sp.]
LAKGQIKLGGLFLRTPDKNYVLMRLDAEGQHPYSVVYHEYTHLLLSKADWMPLWLNEGLAEFYQNTDIHEKDVLLGQPNPENLELLRQNRLLPLATLFTVDTTSPYYHEENKGSIFYAESWALTYYLYHRNYRDKSTSLSDYEQLLAQKVDAVTAASRAFGDLKQLQSTLESFVRHGNYEYFRMASTTEVDDSSFQTRALTPTDAEAVRADFLAYNGRTADARVLLDHVLQADPNNVNAHETMGFLAFHAGQMEEARNWYAQAVKLDSHSFLAHYYFAAMSMHGEGAPADDAQVESSLRASIKLNPSFAPSYDALAVFLGMRRRNLEDARMMALNAVQLEPANLNYRLNVANVLLRMGRGKDAVAVLRNATHLAKTPLETKAADGLLQQAEESAQAQEERQEVSNQMIGGTAQVTITSSVPEAVVAPGAPVPEVPIPDGPHHFVVGLLKNVHCDSPVMDLNVVSGGKSLGLHAGNYFKVQYSVLNVSLKGELKPCEDLEGKTAKVEYVESAAHAPVVVAIEIRKRESRK